VKLLAASKGEGEKKTGRSQWSTGRKRESGKPPATGDDEGMTEGVKNEGKEWGKTHAGEWKHK